MPVNARSQGFGSDGVGDFGDSDGRNAKREREKRPRKTDLESEMVKASESQRRPE